MQGLLLGLSSGAVCATYCAPVLVPYLLGEGRGVLPNAASLGQFLAGRLLGYFCFALFARGIHGVLPQEIAGRDLLLGAVYLVLSLLMIHYGFFKANRACPATQGQEIGRRPRAARSPLFPLFLGLATGLNLCPPLLLAVATAAEQQTINQSILFFCTFFLGTSVFLIPAPFLGLMRGFPSLQVIGKMAAGLIGAYYLFIGATLLAGGVLR